MKSPVPYFTDSQYAALPPSERWLIAASAYVGVHEVGGNNRGPMVSEFLASVGLGAGFPWCAAFLRFTAQVAGIELSGFAPDRALASVMEWARHAEQRGLVSKAPRRGTAMYWLNGDGTGHIGLVTAVTDDGKRFRTIEGNTNDMGVREGDAVARKVRAVYELKESNTRSFGFIDLAGVAEAGAK